MWSKDSKVQDMKRGFTNTDERGFCNTERGFRIRSEGYAIRSEDS